MCIYLFPCSIIFLQRFLWEAWQDLNLIILIIAALLSLALGIKKGVFGVFFIDHFHCEECQLMAFFFFEPSLYRFLAVVIYISYHVEYGHVSKQRKVSSKYTFIDNTYR